MNTVLTVPTPAQMFESSVHQQDIFDFITDGVGDLFVMAVAGSGKTTTIIQAAKRISQYLRERSLFVAFNKSIAEELATRLPSGVEAKTIHAMGWRVLNQFVKTNPRVWKLDGRKYSKLVDYWFLSNNLTPNGFRTKEQETLIESIVELSDKARLTLSDIDAESLESLAVHYELELSDSGTAAKCLADVFQWAIYGTPVRDRDGRNYAISECYDFTDMIYMPITLTGVSFPQYEGFIFVDECQDLNNCQREFILKLRGKSCRMVFVGDKRQAIYGFAGANTDSVNKIQEVTGAKELPLSTCYRCAKSVIELAQSIVPEIQYHDGAEEGIVSTIYDSQLLGFVKPGDLILCRMNAPLIKTCFELIRAGKNARIRGRDIAKMLTRICDAVESNRDYSWAEFPALLKFWNDEQVKVLDRKEASEMAYESLNDKTESLLAIYDMGIQQNKCHNIGDLRGLIDDLFSDSDAAIVLSSVHRAKGTESRRVFIIRPDLLPHPKAKGWQVEQELNLEYVAYTRAMKELWLVTKED